MAAGTPVDWAYCHVTAVG